MKRSVSEILRRGFESMLANWPLLVIRFIESIVLVIVFIITIIAVIVPIAISIGGHGSFPQADPNDIASWILGVIAADAWIIIYMLLLVSVVLTVWIGVHSFVEAGSARIYVDSMQRNAALPAPRRDELDAFTFQRWLAGGKEGWWTVFWIYNIAWAIALVVLIVPFIVFGALALAFRSNGPVAVVAGCLGILAVVLVVIPVSLITGICIQKAIVDVFAKGTAATDSLRLAWREFRSDFGRHIAVAAVMFVVSIVLAIVISSFSMMASLGHQAPTLMTIPLQFSSSLINSIFGAAVGAWFLACFAALAVEPS